MSEAWIYSEETAEFGHVLLLLDLLALSTAEGLALNLPEEENR